MVNKNKDILKIGKEPFLHYVTQMRIFTFSKRSLKVKEKFII